MRILFLSNFYPPYTMGGMELTCESVVAGLSRRGHVTYVLTSRHGIPAPVANDAIARLLYLEMSMASYRNAIDFFLVRDRRTEQNREILRHTIHQFQPDILFIWGMWDLDHVLAQDAEQIMGGRVLYRFGDYWPSLPSQYQLYWDRPGKHPMTRLGRKFIRPVAGKKLQKDRRVKLNFPNVYCNSQATKTHLLQLGVPIQQAAIIYNGLDLSPYGNDPGVLPIGQERAHKAIFLGRLTPVKGADLAIAAMGHIRSADPKTPLTLDIIGDGESEYIHGLQQMVQALGLSNYVRLLGAISHDQVPEMLARYQYALIPSIWEDPFPRVAIEAMAAGCVVVGSDIGGLSEIIEHNRSGYLHPSGDTHSLAQILTFLEDHPDQADEIAAQAWQEARRKFGLQTMLDQVESLLFRINSQQSSPEIGN